MHDFLQGFTFHKWMHHFDDDNDDDNKKKMVRLFDFYSSEIDAYLLLLYRQNTMEMLFIFAEKLFAHTMSMHLFQFLMNLLLWAIVSWTYFIRSYVMSIIILLNIKTTYRNVFGKKECSYTQNNMQINLQKVSIACCTMT